MTFTATLDVRQAIAAIGQLERRTAPAVLRALNRAISSARTDLTRSVSKDLGVKQAVVTEAVSVQNATSDRLTAVISARVKRLPLVDFGAKGPEPSRGKGRGVTAKVQGQPRTYPHAFIARMRSGHRGVFERSGPSRSRRGLPSPSPGLPIHEKFGPSIAHVASKHAPAAAARGQEQFIARLRHELERELKAAATR